MVEYKHNGAYMQKVDWEGIVSAIVIGVLVILCAGDPDLLDAIISNIMVTQGQ